MSIKHRLLIMLSLLVCIGGGVSALANYIESGEEVEEVFDAEMAQMARIIQSLLASQLNHTNLEKLTEALEYQDYQLPARQNYYPEYTSLGHKYETKMAFQVRHVNGDILIQSDSAQTHQLPLQKPGYHDVGLNDGLWRVFSLYDHERSLYFQVAHRHDVRDELTHEIAKHALWPAILVFPLIVIGIAWTVARGLRPLSDISRALANRDYANLSPLTMEKLPTELEVVLDEINSLFGRLSQSAERERRFTSDAAHELRTPLAATKIHLQNAQQSSDPEITRMAVATSLKALDRGVHLVEQLLALSRLDHERVLSHAEPVNLSKICEEVLRDASLAMERKQILLESNCQSDCLLEGNEMSLHMLIRNLVDNAIRYMPVGGKLSVSLSTESKSKVLCIEDNGSGIPDAEMDKVMQRFYRGKGKRAEGSGLGLSICQEIATIHSAALSIANRPLPATGIVVRVIFP